MANGLGELALSIVGQFGIIGLLLAFGSLMIPADRVFMGDEMPSAPYNSTSVPLAILVFMCLADAVLNSFIFYPAYWLPARWFFARVGNRPM